MTDVMATEDGVRVVVSEYGETPMHALDHCVTLQPQPRPEPPQPPSVRPSAAAAAAGAAAAVTAAAVRPPAVRYRSMKDSILSLSGSWW